MALEQRRQVCVGRALRALEVGARERDDVGGRVEAFTPFTLAEVAGRINQDVLLLAGEDDQFVPLEQIGQMERALVNARSVTTKVYDQASGGSEHSQLGASTLWQADFFDWMEEKFGE